MRRNNLCEKDNFNLTKQCIQYLKLYQSNKTLIFYVSVIYIFLLTILYNEKAYLTLTNQVLIKFVIHL